MEKITARDYPLSLQMIAATGHAMEVMTVVLLIINVEQARGIVILILTVNLDLLVEKITVEDLALTPQMIAATAKEVIIAVHQKLHVERMREIVILMLTVNMDCFAEQINVVEEYLAPLTLQMTAVI